MTNYNDVIETLVDQDSELKKHPKDEHTDRIYAYLQNLTEIHSKLFQSIATLVISILALIISVVALVVAFWSV